MPGFFLTRQDEAQAVRAVLDAANLKVQFDCYHCQIVEGDLTMKLRRDMAGIGHIQIAGVPDRHEPDLGELNYPCSSRSTRWATTAGSAASTGPARARRPAWAGRGPI